MIVECRFSRKEIEHSRNLIVCPLCDELSRAADVVSKHRLQSQTYSVHLNKFYL